MTRARILLFLLVLLGWAVFYSWYASPRQQRVPEIAPRAGPERAAKPTGEDADRVGLDFSGGEMLGFNAPRRDLFRALYQKAKIVARPVVVGPPAVAPSPPVPIPPPPVSTRPAPPPDGAKPIPAMKIVGYLEKGSRRTVFLSSLTGELYLVERGDRFADGLLVRELNAQQIVISRGQDDQGVRLSLGEAHSRRIPDGLLRPDRPSPPPMSAPEPSQPPPGVPASATGQ